MREALLAEYAQARGVVIEPPIPIEDIVEKHLKLGIEFDDMHRLFGVPRSGIGFDPDILGAIWFDRTRIVIDESLDPEEQPVEGGPLSLHAGARGRRALAAASPPVRQGPGAGLLVRTSRRAVASSAGRARRRNGSNGRRISMPRAC